MKQLLTFATLPTLLLLATLPSSAEDALPRVAEKLEINGNTALLYAAPKPAEGKPWL